jgi:hypothetical protein
VFRPDRLSNRKLAFLAQCAVGTSSRLQARLRSVLIEDWEQVAAVHGEFFGDIRRANTIMQVVRFIDPDWLVEIEADAVVES